MVGEGEGGLERSGDCGVEHGSGGDAEGGASVGSGSVWWSPFANVDILRRVACKVMRLVRGESGRKEGVG